MEPTQRRPKLKTQGSLTTTISCWPSSRVTRTATLPVSATFRRVAASFQETSTSMRARLPRIQSCLLRKDKNSLRRRTTATSSRALSRTMEESASCWSGISKKTSWICFSRVPLGPCQCTGAFRPTALRYLTSATFPRPNCL